MKISNREIPHGLFLAPMAGVTDISMRRISGEYGAEYAVSEMVSAKALVYEQASRDSVPIKTALLCRIEENSIPTAIQLFGAESEFMAEAARLLSNGTYRGFCGVLPDSIDINMGCPVKKVVNCGEGSALMRSPQKIYDIAHAVVKASSLPVTVKLRAGWDRENKNAVECALAAQSAGVAAVCIHGRTRSQFYSPGVDLDIIGEVVAALSVPVIGNGDIFTASDAKKMLDVTGCDGIALARGAMGAPWLFSEIASLLDGREYTPPSRAEIMNTALRHLSLAVADKGERRGLAEAKVVLSHYLRGIRGATRGRVALMNSTSADEARVALISAFESEE